MIGSSPSSDGQLCRQFLDGDSSAFGELVARHQETVYRLARRYAGSSDEARDLAQRAFLQAFEAAKRAFPRLERESGGEVPFRAWLLRIAVNLGKNAARDRARWPRAPLAAVDSERQAVGGAVTALERAEAEALTRQAVLRLSRRQREVFTLRIDGGLTFADVAATLGITEGNAKTHFHYAVKRLREDVQHLMKSGAAGEEQQP